MATDSSSGTLPSSSRLTIDSSSSSARSKLSFLTSSWVFSAILLIPDAAFFGRGPAEFMRTHVISRAHQRGDVSGDRLLQAYQIIAALEHRYNSPPRAAIGGIHQFARHPAEIFRLEIDRCQGIAVVRIEAGGDDD